MGFYVNWFTRLGLTDLTYSGVLRFMTTVRLSKR
jgi:hypothetical protein